MRLPLLVLICVLPFAGTGCTNEPQDVHGHGFDSLLQGKTFRTTTLAFKENGYYRDKLYPAGVAVPASMEEYQQLRARNNGGDDYYHTTPVAAGTEFRVDKFFEIQGDTGGYYLDATILNGPLAGSHVDPIEFFRKDFSMDGDFFVGPAVDRANR